MKPTIGRMVHFAPPQECSTDTTPAFYAAVITQVNERIENPPGGGNIEETVELATFGPNSLYFQHRIPFSEEIKPGHWSWPVQTK